MTVSEGPTTISGGLKKYRPRVKHPEAAIISKLSERESQVLEQCLTETAECVYDESFDRPGAEDIYLGPIPNRAGDTTRNPNEDSGADMLLNMGGHMLSGEQERHVFLRLNFFRYRVMQSLRALRGRRPNADETRAMLRWALLEHQARGELVRINMPLVLAMAKRTRITGVDYAELISEGNLALLRSVDKFDCGRGFKFSTYACRAILKAFSRVATRTSRYRGYFPTEFDPTLEKSNYAEIKRRRLENDCIDELKTILGENMAKLNQVEQRVIRARFALDGEGRSQTEPDKGKTLEQVGEMIGVTKERVRQIQNKALDKLRAALEDGILAT